MLHPLQAEKAPWNYIGVFKLSNINGKKREPIPSSKVDADSDMDSDSSSDEEEEEETNEDIKPILHVCFFSKCTTSYFFLDINYFTVQLCCIGRNLLLLRCQLYVPAKKGGPCGVCKQDTLIDSTTTHMCYMGRHRSCSGNSFCLSFLFYLLLWLAHSTFG